MFEFLKYVKCPYCKGRGGFRTGVTITIYCKDCVYRNICDPAQCSGTVTSEIVAACNYCLYSGKVSRALAKCIKKKLSEKARINDTYCG